MNCFRWLALLLLLSRMGFAADSINCLDRAIVKWEIDMDMYSDPDIIMDIIKNDMFIDQMPGIEEVFGKKMYEPVWMKPMLETVRRAVLEKHPSIELMLCKVEHLIAPHPSIHRMLHHMLLLEDLVKHMSDDYKFMEAIYNYFRNLQKERGITSRKTNEGVFGTVKKATIETVMKNYVKVRANNNMSVIDTTSRVTSLKLNITEALMADASHHFFDNAKAARELIRTSPLNIKLVGEKREIKYVTDQRWVSLYESWNLVFVIGNLHYLHLLLPKLLIPSVIYADVDDYLFERVAALWLSMMFHLLAEHEGRPDMMIISNKNEIARIGGEINANLSRTF